MSDELIERRGGMIDQEAVEHPQHYGGDVWHEPIKVIRAWAMGFALGNAVKYIARAGKKGGMEKKVEDLSKAIFYIEDEIERGESATKMPVVGLHEHEVRSMMDLLVSGEIEALAERLHDLLKEIAGAEDRI